MAMKEYSALPESSRDTGALPSDCLVLYQEHLLWVSYPSVQLQATYSIAQADLPNCLMWQNDSYFGYTHVGIIAVLIWYTFNRIYLVYQ